MESTLESIADRTPLGRDVIEGAPAIAVIAAVAEGFRVARFAAPVSPGSGERWGGLELREPLGRGAFGEVRLAWDPALEREVALKLRHAESGVLRWLDEARALARVRHPNVVVVYGADLRDGRAGIWMERVPGLTLEARLASEGPLAPAEVARIGAGLASALRAVHAAGLLHGDIKSSNVMWDASDPHEPRVVLMDFGAVRETSGDDLLGTLAAAGTPLALAPELFAGAPPSEATDVYALGVLLFRLLTARWPVEGRALEALRAAHRAGERATIASLRRDVPAALARAIERACAADPARRTASAAQLLGELRAVAEPARVWRARVAVAGAVTAVAAAAVLLVPRWLASRDPATFRAQPLPAFADTSWVHRAWSAQGANERAEFAWHAVGIGDLDGDARDEVAVSEIGWSDGERAPGRVAVFFGSAEGPEASPRWTCVGTRDGEGEGTYVVSAGDVNGDGHPDLLTSAIGARDSRGALGTVRLWQGDGRTLGPAPAWTAFGPPGDVGFAYVLAGGFDANGDGYDDVLVSAHGDSAREAGEGIVRMYAGSPAGLGAEPTWQVAGGQAHAGFGLALAAGDADGDGCDDLLVGSSLWSGARAKSGRVACYRGGRGGPSHEPAWIWESTQEGARAGVSIAMGDVDGDGFADAIVSEPFFSTSEMVECGRVLWFRGGLRGLSRRPDGEWRGPATRSRVGTNRVLATDLDGDGFAEIVVGAYAWRRSAAAGEAGLVLVYRGGARGPGTGPDWWASGSRERESFGIALGAAGHPSGDGRRGLLVGAPYGAGPHGVTGRVELFEFCESSAPAGSKR